MRKCVYLTEGECEEKLVKALKGSPSMILPGKVKRFNVIQNELSASMLMQFEPDSMVVLVFDTDKAITEHLKKNIEMLRSLSFEVEVLTVAQVLNFEDEIERATDVTKALDLTRSRSVDDFKRAVNRMKEKEFRNALKRHKLDMTLLWNQNPPRTFRFVKQDAEKVKGND